MTDAITTVSVQLLQQTDRAVLVTLDVAENAVWLPLSQIEIEPSYFEGIKNITLPEWLAIQRGLV